MPVALQNLDWNTVRHLVDATNAYPALAVFVYFCAQILILFFVVALYLLWRKPEPASRHHGNKKAVVLALMTLVISLALKSAITFVINRDRPFVAHPGLLPLPFHVDAASFPSGHALVAFSLAGSLWLSGAHKLGGWLLFAAVFVAFGRVAAGVHYPTDVIGGALLGLGTAIYLHREASVLKRYLPDHG